METAGMSALRSDRIKINHSAVVIKSSPPPQRDAT